MTADDHPLQRTLDELRRFGETLEALKAEPEPWPTAEEMVDAQIAKHQAAYEAALDRHARRQKREQQAAPKKKRRYQSQELPRKTLIAISDALAAGDGLSEIARKHKRSRQLVTKVRDWRRGLRWDVARGQTRDSVVFVRKDETAS